MVIQVKMLLVKFAVHVGVGQKDLGDAALKDHVENVGLPQFVERLCRKHERRVVLSPSLERLNDVGADAWVFQEHPGFIDEEGLEDVANLRVADDRIGPMEDVEKQRLQHLRIFPHALEIEALETRETD